MVQNRKSTTNEPREKQMIGEYITKYLAGQDWHANYKLGNVTRLDDIAGLTDAQIRAAGVRKAFADLIVLHPNALDIYEFQILPRWSKFGQVLAYLKLARQTDSLSYYKSLPINGIIVNAVDDPFLASLCQDYGIQYRVYSPEWLPLYFETLRPRDYTPSSQVV